MTASCELYLALDRDVYYNERLQTIFLRRKPRDQNVRRLQGTLLIVMSGHTNVTTISEGSSFCMYLSMVPRVGSEPPHLLFYKMARQDGRTFVMLLLNGPPTAVCHIHYHYTSLQCPGDHSSRVTQISGFLLRMRGPLLNFLLSKTVALPPFWSYTIQRSSCIVYMSLVLFNVALGIHMSYFVLNSGFLPRMGGPLSNFS